MGRKGGESVLKPLILVRKRVQQRLSLEYRMCRARLPHTRLSASQRGEGTRWYTQEGARRGFVTADNETRDLNCGRELPQAMTAIVGKDVATIKAAPPSFGSDRPSPSPPCPEYPPTLQTPSDVPALPVSARMGQQRGRFRSTARQPARLLQAAVP